VKPGHELVRWISRPVPEPGGEIVSRVDSRHDDRLASAGRAHRVYERLHAGAPPAAGKDAAAAPALPAEVTRLVVKVEDDCRVSLERSRHRRPECRRMVEVCHPLLPGCPLPAGRIPVKVEDRVQARVVEASHKRADRCPVSRAAVTCGGPVDTEPAVLVQRDAHGVDVPGRHGGDRARACRPSKHPQALDTRILRAREVHSEQPDRTPVRVDEPISGHSHAEGKTGTGAGSAGGGSRDHTQHECQVRGGQRSVLKPAG
jgi:hypothetical protein